MRRPSTGSRPVLFRSGFVAGALIGALVGGLLAPQRGAQLCELIIERSLETKDRLADFWLRIRR